MIWERLRLPSEPSPEVAAAVAVNQAATNAYCREVIRLTRRLRREDAHAREKLE